MPKPQRGVEAAYPKNNRFRRLVMLCGLSVREAAEVCDISEKTAAHKMAGTTGITGDEERAFVRLWRRIRNPKTVWDYQDDPSGAVLMHMALLEVRFLDDGEEPDPEVTSFAEFVRSSRKREADGDQDVEEEE